MLPYSDSKPIGAADFYFAINATFRFIEVKLMELVATWTPSTPEMEAKVMFGRHIWDFAQMADWLGKRTFELRQPEHYTLRPVDSYDALLQDASKAESTSDRRSLISRAVSGDFPPETSLPVFLRFLAIMAPFYHDR